MIEEDTTRAFWVQAPGHGALVDGTLAEPADGEVVVRALYSGISRGTETLVFRGEVPPSQHAVMRCPFQEGDFPGPVKYGYMSVGRVEDGRGPDAERLVGSTVFCLHPHQDRYVVPAQATVVLPSGVPAERAVLAANVETAINGLWDGTPRIGDRMVVVGAGVVGTLVAYLARDVAGLELTLVDRNRARADVAGALGIPFSTEVPVDAGADLVVHASGDPGGLRAALAAVGVEGTLVELSWFGSRTVELPLGEDFHARRITLRSSQVGRLPRSRTPRWDHRRRLGLALRLLRDPALDVLFTGESAFEDLPDLMERLAADGGDTLCHRVRYPAAEAAGADR